VELLRKLGEAEVLGIRPGPLTAVINRAGRTNDARLVMAEIRQSYLDFSGQVRVANTVVPTAVAYNEAATARCPVHRMRSTQAYTTMHELVWELLPNLHGVYAGGGKSWLHLIHSFPEMQLAVNPRSAIPNVPRRPVD